MKLTRVTTCLLSLCAGLVQMSCIHAQAADEVRVNYLTSLHASGPSGWPAASNPRTPVIIAEDGNLYGMANKGGQALGQLYTLPASQGHYQIASDLEDDYDLGLRGFLSPFVQHPDSLDLYSTAYYHFQTDTYPTNYQGAIFRTEFDGAYLEVVEESVGNVHLPLGVLILSDDNTFYGVDRGPDDNGRIYALNENGEFQILHAFGTSPAGKAQFPNGMILASDGWLYGLTAYRRGYPFADDTPTDANTEVGALYRLDPSDPQSFEILHTFTLDEGEIPWWERYYRGENEFVADNEGTVAYLVEGPDGYLYGATSIGSCYTTGVSLSTGTPLLRPSPLCGRDYDYSEDGDVYVTEYPHYDGPTAHGALFRIQKDGQHFSILHRFSGDDGSQPRGPMVVGPDGNVYGTTLSGGANKSLYGRFYDGKPYPEDENGMTYDGTLYRLVLADIVTDEQDAVQSSGFEHLHSFKGGIGDDVDGKVPTGLSLGTNGYLYGTTQFGGRAYTAVSGREFYNDTGGTVFEVSLNTDIPEASITLTAAPGQIALGEIAEITWTSVGTANCAASGGADNDGWEGSRENEGSVNVSPSTSGVYYYTLTCNNTYRVGQVSNVITLYVDAAATENDGDRTEYGNGAGAFGWPSILCLFGVSVFVSYQRRQRQSMHKGKV